MNDLPLGKIIEGTQQRDAIHIAVAPVVASERLVPGAHIGFIGKDTELVGVRSTKLLGIVDPFLTAIVEREQRFWMFLYPQTITSLRHDWTHPAFVPVAESLAPSKAESEQWLRKFAADVDVTYGQLLDAAKTARERGYGTVLNYDTPSVVYEKQAEAWRHYEIVTGETITDEDREAPMFSCAC